MLREFVFEIEDSKPSNTEESQISSKNQPLSVSKEFPVKVYDNKSEIDLKLETQNEVSVKTIECLNVVVYGTDDNSVRLKIKDDLFISVPKVLFEGKESLLKLGQPLIYSIKERRNGFKFQDFEPNHVLEENPYKEEISKVLSSIQLKP